MGSRTKVEAIVAPSFSVVDNSQIALVLRVITFAKWTGFLPVIIAQNSGELISLNFAGFRLATFVWLSTFAFHVLLSFGYFEQYLSTFITQPLRLVDAFIYVLVILTFICSSLVIPRITLTRKDALESVLNEILHVDSLLCAKLKDTTSCITASILITLVSSFMLILSYVRLFYFLDWDAKLLQTSILTFGTGSTLVGAFCYGLWTVYYYLSIWIIPLQLYAVCRCLSRYFGCLAKKIRQDVYPDNNSFEVRVLQSAQMLTQETTHNSLIFTKRLQKLHEAAIKLVKAAEAVDEYFGLSVLLFVVSRLLNILLRLHRFSQRAFLTYGTTDEVFKILIELMVILRQVVELLFVIWVADSLPTAVKKCQQEVMNMPMPQVNFYELEAIKHTLERLESLQLQWFRNQIIGMKVKLSAFGVFPISRELIPPIFGAIVTYFLILLQFTNVDDTKTAGKQ